MKIATLLTVACILASCATAPPTNSVIIRCPHKSAWSASDKIKLADALAPIPADSIIMRLELDWQAMRDADDACAMPQK